jgi:trans-2-enoyl-CoA reductase
MMECPAYQDIRDNFQELYNDCQGDMRKLMCQLKQHLLAKLVHQFRTFRDEYRLLQFDVDLDSFDSDIELNPLMMRMSYLNFIRVVIL